MVSKFKFKTIPINKFNSDYSFLNIRINQINMGTHKIHVLTKQNIGGHIYKFMLIFFFNNEFCPHVHFLCDIVSNKSESYLSTENSHRFFKEI